MRLSRSTLAVDSRGRLSRSATAEASSEPLADLVEQRLVELVRQLGEGGGDLVDRGAELGGQGREGVEVEPVELGDVAGEQAAQLGRVGVVEQRPQVLAGERV